MDVLEDFKNNLRLLSVTDSVGHFRPISYVTHFTCHGILLMNLVFFVQTKWDDIDDRFLAFKAFAYVIMFSGLSFAVTCDWDNFSEILIMFERMNIDIPYMVSQKRRKIFKELQDSMRRFSIVHWTMIRIYVTLSTTLPVILIIVRVSVFSEDFQTIIKESSAVPFPLHYPETIKTFPDIEWLLDSIVYLIGHIFESFYMLMTGYLAHLAFVSSLSAMGYAEFEFKQLSLSLTEMEDFISGINIINTLNKGRTDDPLGSFLKYLVQHHQAAYRKFDVTSKGVRWIALIYSCITSLYVCMALYTIVQKDQIILKTQEAVFSVMWITTMFLFCFCGECVKTENENFMKALYECTWVDKPIWFKRSLLTMMTRACRSVDIKPYGLYGFNLNAFATTMNAAYCYYNVLSGFKDKH